MANYTVQAGDTLFKIARDNDLTLQNLLDANPSIRNPNFIQVGDIVLLPVAAGSPTGVGADDVDIMARTIMGEARGESEEGKIAVGWVIKNRVNAGKWFSGDVYEVCRKPYQFSCWNQGDPSRVVILAARTGDPVFDECIDVARRVLSGSVPDPTGVATHYYANYISKPAWADSPAIFTVKIGVHLFYKNVA